MTGGEWGADNTRKPSVELICAENYESGQGCASPDVK